MRRRIVGIIVCMLLITSFISIAGATYNGYPVGGGAIRETASDTRGLSTEPIINQPPTADFTYIPSNPTSTDIVHFTDISTDVDGVIVAWYWYFDNGYFSDIQNPSIYFGQDGTYNVTLLVEDDGGASDSITKTIVVYTPPNNQPNIPMRPFGLRFGRTGRNYAYLAKTNDPDGDDVYYRWDWGDGNMTGWIGPYGSGLVMGRFNSYAQPGTYFIKVKARDSHGAESDWSLPLPVTIA